jgi:8-oxo-dGTP pyrophosphatase MutT (NUDIX family)
VLDQAGDLDGRSGGTHARESTASAAAAGPEHARDQGAPRDNLFLVVGPDDVPRRAGRVLPIDPRGRVLLLFGFDPADPSHPFWFTVGGGAEPGESFAEAAARELREEVGIVADAAALGEPVWQRIADYGFAGMRFRQKEEYFLLHVDSPAVSMDGMDLLERQTVTAYRWWGADELESAAEPVKPAELPALVRRLTLPAT